MKNKPTCSFVLASLLSFLELYFLKVFLQFQSFKKIVSKAFKLRQQKRSLRRRSINKRWKWRPLSRDLDCKGKIFGEFFCSLCLSCFCSLNFNNLCLDCLCNFSTKFSFTLILKIENDRNLFVENENEKVICSLPIAQMPSSCFMQ